MIRYRVVTLATGLALVPTLAVAQTPPAPKTEKRICKPSEPLGSRIPKQVCRTAAEWQARMRANDQAMQQYRGEGVPGAEQPVLEAAPQ